MKLPMHEEEAKKKKNPKRKGQLKYTEKEIIYPLE
jgi:hypothetical protein